MMDAEPLKQHRTSHYHSEEQGNLEWGDVAINQQRTKLSNY